jgi:hypothetical protein
MVGSIRAFVGFMIAYGAVGTLECDPVASELTMAALALLGLAIMASGVFAMNRSNA